MASVAAWETEEFLDTSRINNSLLTSERRQKLHAIISSRSFREGSFTLSSGEKSSMYFNMKPTMMCAEGAALSAMAFLDIMRAARAEYVSGLEMGAVPAIGAMAAVSEVTGEPVATTFVRKRKKNHGTRDVIEGLGPDESLRGKRVFVIDDVATSGRSILNAIIEVRAAGGIVKDAAALVNRHEGGDQLLESEGVKLHQVFSASNFVD